MTSFSSMPCGNPISTGNDDLRSESVLPPLSCFQIDVEVASIYLMISNFIVFYHNYNIYQYFNL